MKLFDLPAYFCLYICFQISMNVYQTMEIALNLVQTSMEATPAHANSVIT